MDRLRRSRARAARRVVAFGLAAVLAATGLVACSGGGEDRVVTVLGSWTGAEEDAFDKVVAPFERDTGIHVRYEGTRDVDAVLAARVDADNPPDLAALSSPGDLITYARTGRLKPLDAVPGIADNDKAYAADWARLGEVDGVRVAVVVKAALKSLVWYNPKTLAAHNLQPPESWTQLTAAARGLASAGITPWCIGLASSSTSGWPGTDWIEDIVLSRYGPAVYDQWTNGELAWNDPRIRTAWQTWGELLAAGRTDVPATAAPATTGPGNAMSALLTGYDKAGAGLFGTPPGCGLEHQASFAANWYRDAAQPRVPGADFDFTAFPAYAEPGAGPRAEAPAREVGGDVMAMFDDTPEARQLITYLAGADAQTLWVEAGSLSANRNVPLTAYAADPVTQKIGRSLAEADVIRFDASDRMPGPMRGAFHRAILAFTANPTNLDAILADLEQTRLAAYT
ncbi:ABC transporter substrate-binding protein [Yinghuangia sp. ASG 101]|uniref:ABC transporter substrate-binding protein n=1 Tax=Yinghuangia sp. ASG 101 TaxID=2896848 RepID=UPI001E658F59|nr:ABC transporter substrate-binding protein [Yinghuangia sp. ASG 101]UGQ13718.1 ABC transporter substrate-binding protein [Yinghuangia sp. ASG 101]